MLQRPPTVIEFPSDAESLAEVCCRAADELEGRGEDDEACQILASVWRGPNSSLDVGNLSSSAGARLLLHAGRLTAKLGSKRQIEGWQEKAKDILSRSAELADIAGEITLWGEARKSLAICYWREGEFDQARIYLRDALERVRDTSCRFALSVEMAMVEQSDGHPQSAIDILRKIAPLLDSQSHLLKATYHNGLAVTLKKLGRIDDALTERTGAAYHFEQAGHRPYQVAAEINLANLFVLTRRFSDAHERLDRAEHLALQLHDDLHLAQALDSRALAYMEEGNFEAAELPARRSVEILDRGDEHALRVESLVTHARVLSRLGDDEALKVYVRAYELAADRIGSERAARIALEMIGELAGGASLRAHLGLDDAVDAFEESVIRAGLQSSGGRIGEAAMRLGLKPSTLSLILRRRHTRLHPNPERKSRQKSLFTNT